MLRGSFVENRAQSSRVGDGGVDEPVCRDSIDACECLTDRDECWDGLLDTTVGSVDARDIAIGTVSRDENDTRRECAFDGDQKVVRVDFDA